MRRSMLLLPIILFCCARISACPVCSTSRGAEVRSGIFNADFIPTMGMVLAPVPIFIVVVLLLHFGLPWRKERSDARATLMTTMEEES